MAVCLRGTSPTLVVAQEAGKFMRHSKRTVLSGDDIFMALRAKNVQVRNHSAVDRRLAIWE